MYHYVYRITHKELNKHYYGCRTSAVTPKEDIGIKYFSSSKDKTFINDQKTCTYKYKYKVVKMFTSRELAIEFEILLHNKFDVGKNPKFYNRCKQTAIGFDTTGSKLTFSKEHLDKLRACNIGRVVTEHQREMIRNTIVSKGVCKGSNNPRAAIIEIYNADGVLMYACNGNFKEICRINNLPTLGLAITYRKHTKLYENTLDDRHLWSENAKSWYQYKGWYAIKKDKKEKHEENSIINVDGTYVVSI